MLRIMIRISPYLSVVIGLLLVLGPWYQAGAVDSPFDDQYCDCCQGVCGGCCCAEAPVSHDSASDESVDGCQCDITDIPPEPELPQGFLSTRLSNESTESNYYPVYFSEFSNKTCQSKLARTESLPPVTSRPAFVLFSVILI